MGETTILGIDPGSRTTGYGVVRMTGGRAEFVASGCIDVAKFDMPSRLSRIFEGIGEVIAEFAPQQAAVEKIFMNRNPDSALKLGQARGSAIVACATQGLEVFEYSATEIKQAIVGRGHADKVQIQHMVTQLLAVEEARSDAADALAAALCHGHTADGLRAIQFHTARRRRRRAS